MRDDARVDARIERTRAAVLRSATELLVDGGPSAVTVDAIVARSGVAKSTIYRHWASRDDILFEVIEHCCPRVTPPDPALGFEARLRALMSQLISHLADPGWARVMPALMMLRHHQDGIADLDDRLSEGRTMLVDELLRQGVAEGLLRPDIDPDDAVAELFGPLFYAQLARRPPLDTTLSDRVIAHFLAANAPKRPDEGRSAHDGPAVR